jgi:hypothetical protein
MINDLTLPQRELALYMSGLSEEAYCAGWMAGLEYALWEAVLGSRDGYGHLVLTPEHTIRLRQLSAACGGWIIFDDEHEETWVPSADWERRFLGVVTE